MILYYIILSHIILFYIVLCYIILSYIILSYIIWYDIILYYILYICIWLYISIPLVQKSYCHHHPFRCPSLGAGAVRWSLKSTSTFFEASVERRSWQKRTSFRHRWHSWLDFWGPFKSPAHAGAHADLHHIHSVDHSV
jgi:hypothetical protein